MIIDLTRIYNSRQAAQGFGNEEFLAGLGGLVDSTTNNAAFLDEGPMVEASSQSGSLDSTTQDFYLAVTNSGDFNT